MIYLASTQQVFHARIHAFDDVFVVRYAADAQAALELHTDAGEVSFMVRLDRNNQRECVKAFGQELSARVFHRCFSTLLRHPLAPWPDPRGPTRGEVGRSPRVF